MKNRDMESPDARSSLRFSRSRSIPAISAMLLVGLGLAFVKLSNAQQAAIGQPLYVLPPGIETRWASPGNPSGAKGSARANTDRKQSPAIPLKAGEKRILAEASGQSGTVRRIWMTVSDRSPKMLRGIRLDFYWEGAPTPAVSAPLGDFFGIGLGETVAFQSTLFSSPEGRSFNSFVPMPFRTGMRMVITNETDTDLMALYYDVDFTVGDKLGPDVMYFHTYFHRENPTKMQHDYEALPTVAGKGRFLGMNLGVIANKSLYAGSWWGEGAVKVYLDGEDQFPALSGTGIEDYIGTAYGMGPFAHSYQGAPIVDNQRMRFAFYRYHVEDPVYFREAIRVTIQQIGIILPNDIQALSGIEGSLYKAGPGLIGFDKRRLAPFQLFEREDDWSSCAYFYLDKPENKLPGPGDVRERVRGL